LIKELHGLGLDVEIKYSDGTFGELVMGEEDEKGHRIASLRPDASVNRESDDDFLTAIAPNEQPDIFSSATEYSGLDLTVMDADMQEKSDELFLSNSSEPSEDDGEAMMIDEEMSEDGDE
jgi:DNA-directed RNA polymerase subunit beta